MTNEVRQEVTRLLQEAGSDSSANDRLLEVVYDHLRRMAQARMSGERAGHTLEATGLVHEVFIRLVGDSAPDWQDRGHFYAAAGRAMQHILIDHARRRKAEKRGGGRSRVPLSIVDLADDADPDQIVALDEAMHRLEADDPRAAAVVRLRFFAGLDVATVAQVLDISERTVMREWAYSRAKLFADMAAEHPDEHAE